MEKTEIKISKKVKQKISEMAAQTGLSVDKLAEVLLDAFLEGRGKVYFGE